LPYWRFNINNCIEANGRLG